MSNDTDDISEECRCRAAVFDKALSRHLHCVSRQDTNEIDTIWYGKFLLVQKGLSSGPRALSFPRQSLSTTHCNSFWLYSDSNLFHINWVPPQRGDVIIARPESPLTSFAVIVLDVSEIIFQFFKLLSTPFYCLLAHVSGHQLGDFLIAESPV